MAAYFDFLSKILFDTFVFLVFLMAIYNVKFSQIAKRLPPLLLLTLPVSLIATVTDSLLIFTLISYIYCFVFYSLVFRYPPMKIITGLCTGAYNHDSAEPYTDGCHHAIHRQPFHQYINICN